MSVFIERQARHTPVALRDAATDAAGEGLAQQQMALLQALELELGTAVSVLLFETLALTQ